MTKNVKGFPLVLTISILLFFSVLGCKVKATEESEVKVKVLATVNGVPISEEDVKYRTGGFHGRQPTPGDEQKTLERLIRQELIYQKALELGFDKKNPRFRRKLRMMEMDMGNYKRAEMGRQLRREEILSKIKITPEDAKKYYEENAGKIRTELHLANIVFGSEEDAKKALEQIKKGADFEELTVKDPLEDKKRIKHFRDLGFLKWNQTPPNWRKELFNLKKGEVSGILAGRSNYRIFKVLDKRENSKADFKTMKTIIMKLLNDEKAMEALELYVEDLEKKARIVIF